MELAPQGVRVTLAHPPDTDTPGYAAENAAKPAETKRISAASGVFTPEAVAAGLVAQVRGSQRSHSIRASLRRRVAQVRRGDFLGYTGLDGWMLARLTAGMSPAPTLWEGFAQAAVMGVLRLVSLFYLADFASICRDEHSKREAAVKRD